MVVGVVLHVHRVRHGVMGGAAMTCVQRAELYAVRGLAQRDCLSEELCVNVRLQHSAMLRGVCGVRWV